MKFLEKEGFSADFSQIKPTSHHFNLEVLSVALHLAILSYLCYTSVEIAN